MPTLGIYIFTACTNSSISGVCTTTSQTITGYDASTGQLIGCMNNSGELTLSADTIIEESSWTDCTECLSDYSAYRFSGCCDSLQHNFFIPNSGLTAYTYGEVYVQNGFCYVLSTNPLMGIPTEIFIESGPAGYFGKKLQLRKNDG